MWYDVFVVGVLLFCMVRGAMRGVIWQLAGIAGLVLCLAFAESISAAVGPQVPLSEPLNHWVTMFVAYLFFSFLSFGVARLLNGWMEKAEMTEFNKHLGAAFGLVKGVAICLVLTFFIVTLSPSARAMLQHSKSGYAAAVIMDRLHPIMPEKLHDSLEKYIHQLDTPEMPLEHRHDHHHAHDDHAPLFPGDLNSGDLADGPFGNPWNSGPAGSDQNDPLAEILRRIPSLGREQVLGAVEQAYEKTPPSLQDDLVNELKAAAPNMILGVATKWLNQTQAPSPGAPAPIAETRSTLSKDIAALYARAPAEQAGHVQKIDEWLRGLPDSIALGVLRDWKADLSREGVDPDPQTNADTSVDQRIIRQLTVQRVSVYQLSQSLQERLREAARR